MIPTYTVHMAHQEDWWVAQVVQASEDADPAPVRQRTQGRTLADAWDMTRDLIATVLDVDEDAFAVDVEIRPFLNS